MRRYLKTQCLETLKLLDEAHGEIGKYIEKGMTAEAAYLLHEELQAENKDDVRGTLKKLHRFTQRAVNGFKYEIPTQKEVVFLPYKASMWDSLEPVWQEAAKASIRPFIRIS